MAVFADDLVLLGVVWSFFSPINNISVEDRQRRKKHNMKTFFNLDQMLTLLNN